MIHSVPLGYSAKKEIAKGVCIRYDTSCVIFEIVEKGLY